MKSMKIMLSAMLLTMSLGGFAQDDDELLGLTESEEATEQEEAYLPITPIEKSFFQRVHIGYTGTNVKYTNFGQSPDYNNFFLSGVALGWTSDIKLMGTKPLYLELGATFTYHTGRSKGDSIYIYHSNVGDGEETYRHYRIQAFSLTIPVSLTYQFKNPFGVENLTLAPFAGIYARFNLVANRWETTTMTDFVAGNDGKGIATGTTVSRDHRSLMESERAGGWMYGKLHVGKLCQFGAQVGVNAYYKKYSFGLAYMHDITPFAGHKSSGELSYKETGEGGYLPNIGTNCDEKVSTRHNFAVTLGYVF